MFESILAPLALAATEPVKAEPKRDPATWVQARDLPKIDDDTAVTTFDLTVNKSGNPVRCEIVMESGAKDLDAAVCNAVMKRARFRPATGIDRSPIFYVRRDRVIWVPKAAHGNRSYDDADIVVTTPEVAGKDHKLAEVLLSIEKDGSVSRCSVREGSGQNHLDQLACRVASDQQIARPISDATGERVPGIRSLFVAFEFGQAFRATLR